MLKSLMIVGCGSFVGGALRYLLTRTVQNWIDGWMPAGTLAVNVLGCLLIGLFCGLSQEWMPQSLKLFLTVGFCGGFTTFSTFMNENMQKTCKCCAFPMLPECVLMSLSVLWLALSLSMRAIRRRDFCHRQAE